MVSMRAKLMDIRGSNKCNLRDVHGFTLLIIVWCKVLRAVLFAVKTATLNGSIVKNARCDRSS